MAHNIRTLGISISLNLPVFKGFLHNYNCPLAEPVEAS